ncbi:hypothetical protein GCM10012290_02510 [Halolactibacillus alkaliphilus]|uniref:DUF2508 domain-containing protein n=1 Tax=Halolactibacillus alkaliphilus TaxID=442899 RepID=A0A511X4W9_9BACI|nr:YaaL family protein [Halolactibacillus alkaliphilus]GEN57996.1 hypothetical protein HAL01_24600 [Halolactibacillus alkaliphilus]GGN64710.1 hypothetical protein GCM10012290_02510 [Halolactibacillus alkaliphilus]SFP07516.1 Protein of unknown function [Halolactibacillus alkaliphilus]
MGFLTNRKKQQYEQALLDDIYRLQSEWIQVKTVMERSLEPSVEGEHQLKVAEIKYFFLLKEARRLHLNARQK